MGFESLLGNRRIRDNLQHSLRAGRISHFYLISGPKGSGKHTLGRLLAAALLIADGRVLAAGPADEVLTSANVSSCFDHPLTVTRDAGRWVARSAG